MIGKTTSKKVVKKVEAGAVKVAESAINGVEKVVDGTGKEFEKVVEPIRQNVLKRFPTLFLIVVTFGFTAVVTGMEQMLIQSEILLKHPAGIFWLGIAVLIITGRVYKRLS